MSANPAQIGRPSLVAKFANKFGVDPTKLLTTLKHTAFKVPSGQEISDEQMMALLVVARMVIDRPGAAVAAGVLSGAIAVFLGIGDKGALDTLLSYAAAGLGVDAALTIAGTAPRPWAYALAGLAGNLAKLGVKIGLEVLVGIPTGFVLIGRLYPTLTHIVFGLLGGLLGYLVVNALRRAGYFAYLAEKR